MSTLTIYRNKLVFAQVDTGRETVYNGDLMGQNKISAQFKSPVALNLLEGDYIIHNSHVFTLKGAATETRNGKRNFDYSAIFLGREYALYHKKVFHEGSMNFFYTGKAAEHLSLIISNANVSDPGWLIAEVDETPDSMTIQYNDDNCRTAITKIAEAFKLEYEFRDQSVYLKKVVGNTLHEVTFKYGHDKGLYSLSRQSQDDSGYGTVFYGFGGTANLPADYRNGVRELIFEGGKVERNVNKYGRIEVVARFPEIFPERTGTVTATSSLSSVLDSSLNFNLNEVIVDGQAKIVFKSGALNGQEFEITKYDHTSKTVTFKVNELENGYQLPNANSKVLIGDRYTFVGIKMPETYLSDAELRLKNATIEYAKNHSNPPVSFTLGVDSLYLKESGLTNAIRVGDRLPIVDEDMVIDEKLRVQSISYPIFSPESINATISDTVSYSLAEQLIKDSVKHEELIRQTERNVIEQSRSNAVNLRRLQNKVIDPEGNYFTDKIRPGSIETLYFAAGAKATNFSLKGIVFHPNYLGDQNKIRVLAGQLIHYELQIEGVGFIWNMLPFENDVLVSTKEYYIYAKVSRTSLTGEWLFTDQLIRVEEVPGSWHFQTGVLYAAKDGRRDHELTKGMTFIIGDQVTAGVLKSLSGLNYFNLTDGKFNLGDGSSGIDFGVTVPGQLTVKGGVVSKKLVVGYGDYYSAVGDEGEFPLFIGAPSLSLANQAKFRVTRDGTLYAAGGVFEGKITAGAGSKIGDILIDAAGKLNISGTKVEIKPDESIKVFNGGVADFSKASKLIVPIVAPDFLNNGQAAIWVGDLSGLTHETGGYLLPIATSGILGGIKIGSGLNIDPATGVVSVSAGESPLSFVSPLVRTGNSVAILEDAAHRFITDTERVNWNLAFGWGDHAGQGYLKAVSWDIISGKPGSLSQFTNDLGNYGSWITKSQADGWYSQIDHGHLWADITNRPTNLSHFTNDLGNFGNWITKAETDQWYEPGFSVLQISKGGTGSATRNFVDLGSNERVQGIKIFDNGAVFTKNLIIPTQSPTLLPGQASIWLGDLSGLTADPTGYTIPFATAAVLGGVKVGTGLLMDPNTGVLSVNGDIFDLTNYYTKAQSDVRYASVGGGNASGTWGISITGNAATATTASNSILHNGWSQNFGAASGSLAGILGLSGTTASYNYYNAGTVQSFLGLGSVAYRNSINGNEINNGPGNRTFDVSVSTNLRWAYFGNSHVIADNSAGDLHANRINSAAPWVEGYPILMGFNGSSTYGVRVDSSRVSDLATSADNSQKWAGNSYDGTASFDGNPSYVMVHDGINYRPGSAKSLENMLKLGKGSKFHQWEDVFGVDADQMSFNTSAFTYAVNAPYTGYLGHFGTNYGLQLNSAYNGGGQLAFRTINGDNGTRSVWRPILWNGWNIDKVQFAGGVGTSYNTANLEVFRPFESTYSPNLSFHWGGRVAAQIALGSDGVIEIRNNPGTDYESFRAKNITVFGALTANNYAQVRGNLDVLGNSKTLGENYSGSWFRSLTSGRGWFHEVHGGGIYMRDNDWIRTYNNKGFHVENGRLSVDGRTDIASDLAVTGSIQTNTFFKAQGYVNAVGNYEMNNTGDQILWTIGRNWIGLDNYYGLGYEYEKRSSFGHTINFAENSVVKSRISLSTGQAWFNSHVITEGNITAQGSVKSGNWFYATGQSGLYNSTYLNGIYALSSSQWRIYSDTAEGAYLEFSGSGQNNVRGAIHGDGSNNFGLLNSAGSWSLRMDSGSNANVTGAVVAGGLVAGNRGVFGHDSGVSGSVNATNWFRSLGATGWYSQDYGGGIYMADSSYVRTYGGKVFYCDNFMLTSEGYQVNNIGAGLVGVYDATKYQAVFSMGGIYQPAKDGSSLANMYGIAWTHSNAGGQSISGLSHQALFVIAGQTASAIGEGIWTRNKMISGTGTNGGYENGAYNQGHNNIWRLGNAPEHGLAYYQNEGGIDYIGMHFGDRNVRKFSFSQWGDFSSTASVTAPVLKATAALKVPTVAPTLAPGEAAIWIGNLSGITI